MVDTDHNDDCQSAFSETQAEIQAPPIIPLSSDQKKRRLAIYGGIGFFLLLILLMAASPKRQTYQVHPTPIVRATPTPKPLGDVITQEFNNIDKQLELADPETIVAPPQVDMEVEF